MLDMATKIGAVCWHGSSTQPPRQVRLLGWKKRRCRIDDGTPSVRLKPRFDLHGTEAEALAEQLERIDRDAARLQRMAVAARARLQELGGLAR